MRNTVVKPMPGAAEGLLLNSWTAQEITTFLIRIRLILLRGEDREYLDEMQKFDDFLLDLASYFTEQFKK